MIKSYRDLTAWQKAHKLVLDIYRVTKSFPDDEKFGLVSQIRRAAVSVPANIVEGFRRRTKGDKIHFYNYAQSSLDEVDYEMFLAEELGYHKDYGQLSKNIEEAARLLTGLISSIEKSR